MTEAAKGLLIHGTVTGRTRRIVGKENPRTIVTYRINDGKNDFFVDEWSPTECYTVGEIVCLPIYVKIYSRTGVNRLNYIVSSSSSSMMGEEF